MYWLFIYASKYFLITIVKPRQNVLICAQMAKFTELPSGYPGKENY